MLFGVPRCFKWRRGGDGEPLYFNELYLKKAISLYFSTLHLNKALPARAGTCTVDRLRLAALSFPSALRDGQLEKDRIDRAFEGAVEEDKAFFHSEWQLLTAHQQNVLRALAEDERRLTGESARERFNLPASGSVTNTLKSLIQRGVLFETEGSSGYAFDNPFFKHWVHLRNRDDLGLG